MDIASQGSRIDAVRSGKVIFSGEQRGYGNIVILDHGKGLTSRYAHCEDLNVKVGDAYGLDKGLQRSVLPGDQLGPICILKFAKMAKHLILRNILDGTSNNQVCRQLWLDFIRR